MIRPKGKGAEKMLQALAEGQNYAAAARSAGIAETLVRKRLNQKKWRDALNALKRDRFDRLVARLSAVGLVAVERLAKIVMDDSASARDHISAARDLLTAIRDFAQLESPIRIEMDSKVEHSGGIETSGEIRYTMKELNDEAKAIIDSLNIQPESPSQNGSRNGHESI